VAEKLDPKDTVTIEELAISNMREIAAIIELLERKGLCTRQELYDIIEDLRTRNPAALQGTILETCSRDGNSNAPLATPLTPPHGRPSLTSCNRTSQSCTNTD
jgi:hypothetical protein